MYNVYLFIGCCHLHHMCGSVVVCLHVIPILIGSLGVMATIIIIPTTR